ncbi:hypothetical protein CEXT_36681, partial [Caerostris extrusa]
MEGVMRPFLVEFQTLQAGRIFILIENFL